MAPAKVEEHLLVAARTAKTALLLLTATAIRSLDRLVSVVNKQGRQIDWPIVDAVEQRFSDLIVKQSLVEAFLVALHLFQLRVPLNEWEIFS